MAWEIHALFPIEPDESPEDTLDNKIVGGNEILVLRVLCFEKGCFFADHEALEGHFAVDGGSDNVSIAGLAAVFEDNEVAVKDARAGHGIATNFKRKGAGVFGKLKSVGVDGKEVVILGHFLQRHTGGDAAEERDIHYAARNDGLGELDGAAVARGAADGTFFLQQIEMAGHGRGGTKAEMRLDLRERGRETGLAKRGANEVEDFLLAFREVHTVQFVRYEENRRVGQGISIRPITARSGDGPHPAGWDVAISW